MKCTSFLFLSKPVVSLSLSLFYSFIPSSPLPSLLNPSVWMVHLGKLLLNRTGPYDEVVPVLSIHLHRYYDEGSHDYDLALLHVRRSSPALLARRVLPACLPPPSHRFSTSTLCWVTGWGALKENGGRIATSGPGLVLWVGEVTLKG